MQAIRNLLKNARPLVRRGALALLPAVLAVLVWPRVATSEPALPADQAHPEKGEVRASEKIVFAGGCFWGVQAVFQHAKGVTKAISGYAGGISPHPTYEEVSSGRTGHAESVEVTFDPKQISFDQLLQVYFIVAHDPTQLNRQGPDEGSQYRSEIFVTTVAQRKAAEAYIQSLEDSRQYPRPIVTEVDSLKEFYPAENYHQDYATRHPGNPYIRMYDLPKISALKASFPDVYRDQPVLVGDER